MKWGVRKEVLRTVAKQIPSMAKSSVEGAVNSGKNIKTAKRMIRAKVKSKPYSDYTIKRYDKKISKKVGKLDSKYDKNDAITDYKNLGKNSVKRINKRLNRGDSYVKARSIELGRKAAMDVGSRLARKTVATLVGTALLKVGTDCAKYYMNQRMGVKLLDDPNIIDIGPDMYKVLN